MKRIQAGFVGVGWMGRALLQRVRERDDVEVAGIFEPNRQHGLSALKDLGISPDLLVPDFEQLLGNDKIDAIWLVSPNSFHGPQAIAAMEAGKDVFCEKPCATRFADFRRQIELEQAGPGLTTFVDYILYFDSMEKTLRQMVARGEFGEITQIQVNYRSTTNTAGEKAWKLKKAAMGDAIGMGIIHSLSVIVLAMASQARPVAVYATSQAAKVCAYEPEPIWNILIRFDNGATGICLGNIEKSKSYDAYHNLFGTAGGFIFDAQVGRPRQVRYWSEKTTSAEWVWPLDGPRCKEQGLEQLAWPDEATTPASANVMEHQTGACVEHFVDCVKTGRPSPLSFANSAPIAEIGWAAQMSAATGREVPLPLDPAAAEAFFAAQ